jgi:hypothetical protein
MEITREYLKSLLRYDPEIGRFFWVAPRKGVSIGKMAGTINYDGYRRIEIDGKLLYEHRLVWLYAYGEFPADQLDHVNHVRDDNRITNLREVSNQENSRNSSRSKRNTSGITGVHWHKRDLQWRASIKIDGKSKNLSSFEDYFEACCARKSAELRFGFHENHGE